MSVNEEYSIMEIDGKWDVVIAFHLESDCMMTGELNEKDFAAGVEVIRTVKSGLTKSEAKKWLE